MTTSPIPTLDDVDVDAVATLTDAVRSDPDNGATTWKARVDWRGAFRAESRIRDFTITADEPPALGGSDSAPNPVELLLASLGSCFVVGVAANALARQIEVRDISIDLEGELDLQTFLGLAEGHAGYSAIRATIAVDADATNEQISDLIDHVVSTSPVGHTLAAAIPLDVAVTS